MNVNSQAHMGGDTAASRAMLGDVFRARAQRLAQRGRLEPNRAARVPIAVFGIGSDRFGFELPYVRQVFCGIPITPVPGTDRLVLGVASLNGTLRSVLDLGVLLNMPVARTGDGHIVLLRIGGTFFGVGIESIIGVSKIDPAGLASIRDVVPEAYFALIRGMTEDRTVVLDVESMLKHAAARHTLQKTSSN